MILTKYTLGLAAVALAGFGAAAVALQTPDRPAGQTATPPAATGLPAEKPGEGRSPLLLLSGADSKTGEKEYLRLGNAEAWKKAWKRHLGQDGPDPGPRGGATVEIDFGRCEMIAVFRGPVPNCTGIRVHPITETEDRLLIRYEDVRYQTVGEPNAATPYGFVLIPVTRKPVVIERNTQTIIGRPPVWTEEARLKSPG